MAPTTRAAARLCAIKQRSTTIASSFSLLNLPRELRDLIYIATESQCSQADITALLLCSKQVSSEASSALARSASYTTNGPGDKRLLPCGFIALPGLCRRYRFVTLVVTANISPTLDEMAGRVCFEQMKRTFARCLQLAARYWRAMMESEGTRVPRNCRILIRSRRGEEHGAKIFEEVFDSGSWRAMDCEETGSAQEE